MAWEWGHGRLVALVAFALVVSNEAQPAPSEIEEGRATMTKSITSEPQAISENPPDVRLACSVEESDRGIRVHYFLSNESSKTILIFDRVQFNPMNTLTLPVDVVCDAGNGAVNIVLGISPDPLFGQLKTTRPRLWRQDTTAIRSSANVAATIDLALPLVEWDMWNASMEWSKVARADQAVQVHTVRLVVDFVRRAPKDPNPTFPTRTAESVWCAVCLSRPVTLLRHPGFGEFGDPARRAAFNFSPNTAPGREAAMAGLRERVRAQEEHRAFITTPRRRGTSPANMPRAWQDQYWKTDTRD